MMYVHVCTRSFNRTLIFLMVSLHRNSSLLILGLKFIDLHLSATSLELSCKVLLIESKGAIAGTVYSSLQVKKTKKTQPGRL